MIAVLRRLRIIKPFALIGFAWRDFQSRTILPGAPSDMHLNIQTKRTFWEREITR